LTKTGRIYFILQKNGFWWSFLAIGDRKFEKLAVIIISKKVLFTVF
jgi:hypothetical protein